MMNILNYCLRNRVNCSTFSSIKRSYTIASCRASVIQHKPTLLPGDNQFHVKLVFYRCFIKKMGLNPMYNVYNKKAAKDNISPTEYELVYNGIGENYVRSLSGIVIGSMIFVPSIYIFSYFYLMLTEGYINFETYLKILLLPTSGIELIALISTLVLFKIASYSFVSKYVLRIYRHNMKAHHACVYINPVLPWKSITVTFDKGTKLPDSKMFLIPWHKEYYKLGGYKSIVLRERFRRPIDYDRMLGIEKRMDDD